MNKLKFHFRNGNFTDTVDRDFSHYWTLPEVNLEKIAFPIEIFLCIPSNHSPDDDELFNIFNRM